MRNRKNGYNAGHFRTYSFATKEKREKVVACRIFCYGKLKKVLDKVPKSDVKR